MSDTARFGLGALAVALALFLLGLAVSESELVLLSAWVGAAGAVFAAVGLVRGGD